MNRKHISYILLAAVIASTMASAACGGENPSGGETTTAQNETTTMVETSEFEAASLDMKGGDFVIAENDVGDWMQSAFVTEENGDILNDAIYKRNMIVSDLYKVNIKGYKIQGGRNSQKLTELTNSILAGDKEFDIAFIPGELSSIIFNTPDYLIPLSEVKTLDLSHSWWDAQSVEAMTFLGKTISATGDMVVSTTGASTITIFSKKIASDYNYDMYKIVNDGQFTLDKAYELAQAVHADVNGDGKFEPDYDRYGLNLEALNLSQMVNAAGEKMVKTNKDGIPEFTLNTPKAVEVVQKMIKVIDDYDSVVCGQDNRMKVSNFTNMFNEDRQFLWVTNLQRMNSARSYTADFGLLPFPKYDEADEYSAPVNPYWCSWIIVPATNADNDSTGYMLDALGYYSKELVTPAFIETSVTTKALRDDESAEILASILQNKVFDAGTYFNWGYWTLYRMMQNHNPNLASTIASEEATIKSSIDSFIEAIR